MIPFSHINEILSSFEADIGAILLSLPVDPVAVRAPKLLRILTGIETPTIISHELLRIWVAFVFYFNTLDVGKAGMAGVLQTMRREQEAVYTDFEEGAFMVAYLNVYERALAKLMYIFKGGDPGNLDRIAEEAALLSTVEALPGEDVAEYVGRHRESQRACGLLTINEGEGGDPAGHD